MQSSEMEQRLGRLEAIEEIRQLKARYFFCSDRKDPAGMRACFVDGPVLIDYGALGCFDTADAVVKIFEDIGCHPHMVEMHHGVNPLIEIDDDTHAHGNWSLQYFLINTQTRGVTQLGGYYEDQYAKVDGRWKISATRFVVSSTLALSLGESGITTLFAGRAAPLPQ
jgi:hypothetical protein